MSTEKDIVPTNLRLPNHLHIKLSRLADVDDRSLHSLMLKILQDHVVKTEQDLFDEFGFDEFPSVHNSVFGNRVAPYIKVEEEIGIYMSPKDILKKARGEQRAPQSNRGIRVRMKPDAPFSQETKDKIAESSAKYYSDKLSEMKDKDE